MSLHLEHAVSEELEYALVGLDDLALLLLIPAHHDHSSLLCEHDIELILKVFHRLLLLHLEISVLIIFSLLNIILNL
jgi:hypothetical protein